MSGPERPTAEQPVARTVSAARDAARTASARCLCYAAFSELTASPHEVDARASARERLQGAGSLTTAMGLERLLEEFAGSDLEDLKAGYSALFEVGSRGPPAPIREDLQTGQKAGTREDIVRFYDYFGYRLDDRYAWAPDHLSVELEFMHFLCFHEAQELQDKRSYQLAQVDFAERHLLRWVPGLAAAVSRLSPDSFYCRVLVSLSDFLARDFAWQGTTIATAEEAANDG